MTRRRRDVARLLEAIGREPTPPPSQRLLRAISTRLQAVGMTTSPARRRMRPRPTLLLAGAAVAAALLAVVLVYRQPALPPGSIRLASARDATVVLPEGKTVPASPGLVIPQGSQVRTGSRGFVRVGGQSLGAGKTARVASGRLVTDTPAPGGSAPPAAVVRPTPTPAPKRPPTETTKPLPTREPILPPKVTPSPTVAPNVVKLSCERSREGVACRWSVYEGPGFAAYRLMRGDAKAAPAEVFRTSDRAQTSAVDTTARGTGPYQYKLEVQDAEGRVVAAGGPVRVP